MNFCGIICEFNPFHNGHEYIISEAAKRTGAEVVCLMSGDFVQRGIPAIQDKYERAKNAISCGATAVLELPTIYACSNAENFAYGAIKILTQIGAKYLAFGIEKTTLETLQIIAKLKCENSQNFQSAFKNEIENGICYNTALKRAINKTLDGKIDDSVLNSPNNILAVEYLTAILKQKSNIMPIAIERCDNGFLSQENASIFLSASSIRQRLDEGENVERFIPKNAKIDRILSKNAQNSLKMLQILKIRQMSTVELGKIYDCSAGIEHRIKSLAGQYNTYDEIKQNIITPRYREARVNKLLLYPLLNITGDLVERAKRSKPYAKLLAIKKEKKEILSKLKNSKINIIIKNTDYETLGRVQKCAAEIDLNASLIYSTISEGVSNIDKKRGTMFL